MLECVSLNIPLADLPENGCRYIEGDDLLYCGHVRQANSSYCPHHHAIVWVQPRSPRHAFRGLAK